MQSSLLLSLISYAEEFAKISVSDSEHGEAPLVIPSEEILDLLRFEGVCVDHAQVVHSIEVELVVEIPGIGET
jgi:hypothetical protein